MAKNTASWGGVLPCHKKEVAIHNFIFHRLKDKCGDKHKWLRNNASTMTSQIIDTAVFITVAFYGTVPSIIVMIFSQYLIKAIYAAVDTPFFYLLTRRQ